jgi:hypothetical protein
MVPRAVIVGVGQDARDMKMGGQRTRLSRKAEPPFTTHSKGR